MRLATFQSIVNNRRSGSIRFPAATLPRHFWRKARNSFFDCRPPRHLRTLGSSSRTLCSSTEYYRSSVRQKPESFQRLPWGCGPSSRHQPAASKLRASYRSSPCRPRRFSRPRRFPPLLALWAYFIPLPRPGFTLQGFAPRPQPHRLLAIVALSSLSQLS